MRHRDVIVVPEPGTLVLLGRGRLCSGCSPVETSLTTTSEQIRLSGGEINETGNLSWPSCLQAWPSCFPRRESSKRRSIILPSDLPPGAQYQLIFVTAGTRDATSANIDDYNGFVTAEGGTQPLSSFRPLMAGRRFNAHDQQPRVNAPAYDRSSIYNTQGQLVADGLWTGNWLCGMARLRTRSGLRPVWHGRQ